jgi:hypothetical protein
MHLYAYASTCLCTCQVDLTHLRREQVHSAEPLLHTSHAVGPDVKVQVADTVEVKVTVKVDGKVKVKVEERTWVQRTPLAGPGAASTATAAALAGNRALSVSWISSSEDPIKGNRALSLSCISSSEDAIKSSRLSSILGQFWIARRRS